MVRASGNILLNFRFLSPVALFDGWTTTLWEHQQVTSPGSKHDIVIVVSERCDDIWKMFKVDIWKMSIYEVKFQAVLNVDVQ